MKQAHLSAGTIEYDDTGQGPPVVLLHGVMMNHTQWDPMMPFLPLGFRYIRPVLPFGSHRHALRPEADKTLEGQVRLLSEFLDELDLDGVTLVHSDWGGGLFLTALGLDARIAAHIIFPCEAFENFPPGLPGKLLSTTAKAPGGMLLGLRQLRIGWIRATPLMFGRMAKRTLPDQLVRNWTEPALRDKAVRQDLIDYVTLKHDPHQLRERTEALRGFLGHVLILWSPETNVMPPEHGRRLAELMPQATYVEVEDAYVLSMLDVPDRVGEEVSRFLLEHRR